jgi:adenylate cyclase
MAATNAAMWYCHPARATPGAAERCPMGEERAQRHLAAILAADVVGYSRLMERDEAGTLAALKALRTEVFEPQTRAHGGRIFKINGDGALCEFTSAVDAVRAALEVQRALVERNAGLPEERRIALRLGIALGDVIAEGGDLYGHGVNLAARIEGLAQPGGVCVAAIVAEHLQTAGGFAVEDLGEHKVKNIERPVRVFRVAVTTEPEAPAARPALALPDKPSIAVLAFQNMSGDAEQEYFADGIVEDIITALSRIRWLFVIARNSSFTYKGKAVDIKQVGRELGVRYVLEGSVRKAAGRVRITAQLIDATTGTHVWADRFEGPLDDIFDLQDRVAVGVSGIIEPKLRHLEMDRAQRKPTESLDAYDLYLRALARWASGRKGNREALKLLYRAIELDPHYAAPYGLASGCYLYQLAAGMVRLDDPSLAEGVRLAKQGASLARDDAETLAWAAMVIGQLGGDLPSAIAFVDQALAINPNSAAAWTYSGALRINVGDPELAIDHLQRAARLSPLDMLEWLRCLFFASAHFHARRYEEASAWGDRALRQAPTYPPALRLKAAICGQLGRLDEGRALVDRLLAIDPQMTVSSMRLWYGAMWQGRRLEAYLEGLRKAGLPE